MVGFRMSDFDVVFYGATAFASIVSDLELVYGSNTGNWTTDMFIEAAYKSLSSKPGTRGSGN